MMPKAASTNLAVTKPVPALLQQANLPTELALPDGIYLGLDEVRYHADSALGSSNIRDLLKGANLYWWKSWMNPKRPKDKKTDAKIVGSATHKLLLEGFAAFSDIYQRGPWGEEDDHLSPSEKGALTKAAKAKLMEGQELLKADDYDFILGCKDVLDADPELNGCLDNGPSEVSIFWTREDGVRCKVRLDKLKVGGIGDIKTIANERERDLEVACMLDIHTYRYDIPAEHYSEGRRQMAQLFKDGKVFLGDETGAVPFGPKLSPEHKKLIDFLRQCVERKNFGFQFVFIPKKGAPDAWSCTVTSHRENVISYGAHNDIERAIERYKTYRETFGTGQRWLPMKKVEELDINRMPFGFGRVTG